ncbi:MOSC domain-containing protein [Sulfurovum sp.]|uniref:MOSC domain-containing protein n=1 Tax=Sulfurovum sp. TaxID=1969726 RepID=UPI002867D42C|nr:MOSC domain-containing protein [Sulfurovum sp.]
MTSGKVEVLYMSMPDMIRSGHRMTVDDFDCDPDGIIGDLNYEKAPEDKVLLLTSQKSYDLIEEAELYVDQGALLENIHIDIDLNHLKAGSVIEIGEVYLEVTGPCEAYGYLYGFSPELPEILKGNRGLFVRPVEYGRINVGDEVVVVKEA